MQDSNMHMQICHIVSPTFTAICNQGNKFFRSFTQFFIKRRFHPSPMVRIHHVPKLQRESGDNISLQICDSWPLVVTKRAQKSLYKGVPPPPRPPGSDSGVSHTKLVSPLSEKKINREANDVRTTHCLFKEKRFHKIS